MCIRDRDEANIAEAIRFLLTRDGYSVEIRQDGRAALAAVSQMLPDLVILDLMLPGLSGLEVLAELRADPATAALPCLLYTSRCV